MSKKKITSCNPTLKADEVGSKVPPNLRYIDAALDCANSQNTVLFTRMSPKFKPVILPGRSNTCSKLDIRDLHHNGTLNEQLTNYVSTCAVKMHIASLPVELTDASSLSCLALV